MGGLLVVVVVGVVPVVVVVGVVPVVVGVVVVFVIGLRKRGDAAIRRRLCPLKAA